MNKTGSFMPKAIKTTKLGNQITIVKNMRDYSKDPYFVKKFEEAKIFLKKHPIPERFKNK